MSMVIQRIIRLAGHVHRIGNERISKQLLYFKLCEGSYELGRPKLRFNDTAKRNLNGKEILVSSLQMHNKQRDN